MERRPMSRVNRVGSGDGSSTTSSVYSVLDYGASTGSSDNSSAIQAAIDAANAAGGGTVFVPEGTYICNSGIALKPNVAVEGAGPTASILKIADSASGLFSIAKTDLSSNAQTAHQAASTFPVKCFLYIRTNAATTATTQTGIILRNIGVDGNGANQADSGSYANICCNNDFGTILENVHSYNARPSITTTGNQRAYCLLVCDSEKGRVLGGYYYTSGYDVIGERAYARDWDYEGVTILQSNDGGTACRAAFQSAYQNQRPRLRGCNIQNTNSNGSDKAAIISHGSQGGRIEQCYVRANAGACILFFGDNTDGTDDSNWDSASIAYPSATGDEITEDWLVQSNFCEAYGGVPCVLIQRRYNRDNLFLGNYFLKSTTSADLISIDGDYNATTNPTAYTGCRRQKFHGNIFESRVQGSIVNAEYAHYLELVGNTYIRTTATSGHFNLLYGCRRPIIRGNRWHIEAASGNFNRGVGLEHYTQNGQTETCSGAVIEGNTISRQEGSTATVDSYVRHTATTACDDVRIMNNIWDIAPTTNYIIATTALGARWRVENNAGLITESVGTCTVANGATTTGNVAHGLTAWRTLRASDIILTPTNSLGSATKYYVSSIDATNFVVTVNADPGATTATFGWQARANVT